MGEIQSILKFRKDLWQAIVAVFWVNEEDQRRATGTVAVTSRGYGVVVFVSNASHGKRMFEQKGAKGEESVLLPGWESVTA